MEDEKKLTPLEYAKALLEAPIQRNDGYSCHQQRKALVELVHECELPDGWKNEYSKRQPDTEIELLVRNPNGLGWFWSAFDPVTEDSCISANMPGFDTKELAMQAAEDYYKNEWLPRFQATGEREFSHA